MSVLSFLKLQNVLKSTSLANHPKMLVFIDQFSSWKLMADVDRSHDSYSIYLKVKVGKVLLKTFNVLTLIQFSKMFNYFPGHKLLLMIEISKTVTIIHILSRIAMSFLIPPVRYCGLYTSFSSRSYSAFPPWSLILFPSVLAQPLCSFPLLHWDDTSS